MVSELNGDFEQEFFLSLTKDRKEVRLLQSYFNDRPNDREESMILEADWLKLDQAGKEAWLVEEKAKHEKVMYE